MDNLIHRRQVMNLTRKELAELSNLNVYTLTEYELGGRRPKIDNMKKLAEALKCTIDEII